ncbi:DUF6331 family protein [Luteolibacter rhizosphaerae]|uniref:DUF6331 family protein n=1 Tax=Luteolibacter rhizosphaerae TaxID=2989719 RepID=UPI003CE462E8
MTRAADHLDASFPASFIGFTRHCEAYCVAGCCGLDAFSFDDSTLESAIMAYGVNATESMCAESQQAALQFSHETRQCWSSQDDFNAIWDNGSELSKWILEIIGDTRRLTPRLSKQADAGKEPI